MKKSKLTMLIFMALCCGFGLFTKKIINPFANIITEVLHIPGGVSTGFSIMFLVIGKEIVQIKNAGTLMGCVQGFLALVLGRVGSMGILAPIGFIMPGIMIDLVYYLKEYFKYNRQERMMIANSLAAFIASVTANIIVFRLFGPVLWLYLAVSATSGAVYGVFGDQVMRRLSPMIKQL